VASPLLQITGATKRYGAVEALRDVDFEVHAGEVVALVGDNGAGKSTLVKAIAGTFPPDSGIVIFDGHEVTINTPKEAVALGIATVYQDLALCDNIDVVGNLFLGTEETRFGLLDEAAMEDAAVRLMSRLSVRIPSLRTPVASLSGGQRQSVAVARATLGNPRIVMLDEPTAALGVSQTKEVLELIRTLRAQGLGVVVISHNLSDVFAVADRIIVLRLGRRVATFDTPDTTPDEVVAAITGAAGSSEAAA
jgi:D-xylose transport system ATP-binding protein